MWAVIPPDPSRVLAGSGFVSRARSAPGSCGIASREGDTEGVMWYKRVENRFFDEEWDRLWCALGVTQ